jgi:hypothetical protein
MKNPKRKKNASGRPEKSIERTLAQAQAESRRALIDRGGKLLHVRLEADALVALAEIKTVMGFRYDREAIAYALHVAADDLRDERARLRKRAAAF